MSTSLCLDHQGDHAHYDKINCTICKLTAELTSAKDEIERLKRDYNTIEKRESDAWSKFHAAETALASERKETERLREPYRVSVQKMVESGNRITWWVCLDRPDRSKDAKPWDKGRITPYMSADKEKADFTAQEWAEFLGTTVEDAALQERQGATCPKGKSSAVETLTANSRTKTYDAHSCQDCGHEWEDNVQERQGEE